MVVWIAATRWAAHDGPEGCGPRQPDQSRGCGLAGRDAHCPAGSLLQEALEHPPVFGKREGVQGQWHETTEGVEEQTQGTKVKGAACGRETQ